MTALLIFLSALIVILTLMSFYQGRVISEAGTENNPGLKEEQELLAKKMDEARLFAVYAETMKFGE